MNLIKEVNIPIVGICLGLEIITKAFGGTLKELPLEHIGPVQLLIEDSNLKSFIGSDALEVTEGHHIGINQLPERFISCANSKHGVEIIKHLNKRIIGFQFHPEVSRNDKLIEWMFRTLKLKP